MQKILISACLLGEPVRYDGTGFLLAFKILNHWQHEGRLVAICPEISGGLPVPRPPAEISRGDGTAVIGGKALITNTKGNDVTEAFLKGANKALETANKNGIRMAILKSRSPSCGNAQIYDGSFEKNLKNGQGVTAALLEMNTIKVFNELEISEAIEFLKLLEMNHP